MHGLRLQGLNFKSCVWRAVSSQSSHHPQEVLLAQFSLNVHKSGLKLDSFHFIPHSYMVNECKNGYLDPGNIRPAPQSLAQRCTDVVYVNMTGYCFPANKGSCSNALLFMLGQRRGRWPNIKPTLDHFRCFAGPINAGS